MFEAVLEVQVDSMANLATVVLEAGAVLPLLGTYQFILLAVLN